MILGREDYEDAPEELLPLDPEDEEEEEEDDLFLFFLLPLPPLLEELDDESDLAFFLSSLPFLFCCIFLCSLRSFSSSAWSRSPSSSLSSEELEEDLPPLLRLASRVDRL